MSAEAWYRSKQTPVSAMATNVLDRAFSKYVCDKMVLEDVTKIEVTGIYRNLGLNIGKQDWKVKKIDRGKENSGHVNVYG